MRRQEHVLIERTRQSPRKRKTAKNKKRNPNLTEVSILPEKEFKATVTKILTQAKRNTARTSRKKEKT